MIVGFSPFTISVKVFDTVSAKFLALSVTVKVPASVGVPEITPVFEQVKPLGSPDALQVIGAVPVAVRVA